MLTINVAVLLAIIAVLRVRRAPAPRTRGDAALTFVLVLVLGLLLAPTDLGRGVLDVVRQLVDGITAAA